MEPTLNPESGFFRIRLDFSYDGTNFAGWAKQPDQVTIQSTMESAIATFTRETIALTAAGRTDAGVHAREQVAHFDLPNLDHDGFIGAKNYFINSPYTTIDCCDRHP